jgi:hypothetical protein
VEKSAAIRIPSERLVTGIDQTINESRSLMSNLNRRLMIAVLAAGLSSLGAFANPSGYRADLIFRLANRLYQVLNLYDLLLEHYLVIKANDALGTTYDYQLIYQHSALAAYNADATKSYRYALLPNELSLSDPKLNGRYREAAITIPGLGLPDTDATVTIPGTRVVWGLTILKGAANSGNAIKFL